MASVDAYDSEDRTFAIRHYRLDAVLLEIFWFEGAAPLPPDQRQRSESNRIAGLKHVGIEVPNLRAAYYEMKKQGFVLDSEITRGKLGFEYFFIKDPDGVMIEVLEDNRSL